MLKLFSQPRAILVCVLALSSVGCSSTVGDVYSPKEWRDLFEKAGGWAPLPFPESKYRPGSIIKVNEDGIRWIDHLESCGYPPEVLDPEVGQIPAITFTQDRELDANALISFKGVTAGPQFNRISKTRLEVKDHGADALRLINLKIWMETPANRDSVSQACMDALLKPDHFLVAEAFRVSKGVYTLFDQSGAAIKLDAGAVSEFLEFQPDVNFNVTTDGSLVIEEPVYFAVRRAVRVGDDWETLRTIDGQPQDADAKIAEIFLEVTD